MSLQENGTRLHVCESFFIAEGRNVDHCEGELWTHCSGLEAERRVSLPGRYLRLQGIGRLLDRRQDLFHEHLALADPIEAEAVSFAVRDWHPGPSTNHDLDLYSDDVPSLDCRNTWSLTAVT